MAPSRRMAGLVLVLVLLLVATELRVAEARSCTSQSYGFNGWCFSSSNCANVCKTENFPSGECMMDVFTRKCFCKRPC